MAAARNYSYQTFTIRRLSEMVASGRLDLNPDWQRGSVWTQGQKPKLIDSLDNGYPIPSIILWTRPRGNTVMVDGKQRTETIVDFIADGFAAYDDDWFSGRSEEAQQAFLDIEIHALVFRVCVDEDFIVEYFERINSGAKQLSNGELINSLCMKPIVASTHTHFFSPGDFNTEWSAVFSQPSTEAKRMKHHEDTVPYLTSSLFGVAHLTKSYPILAPRLKSTEQTEIDAHMPIFLERMRLFMEISRRIFQECPQLRVGWIRQGLPPLRQTSAIWLSILEPQHIEHPHTFWPTFYRTLVDNPNVKNEWDLHMRKNGKPAQLYKEIQFAIDTLNAL